LKLVVLFYDCHIDCLYEERWLAFYVLHNSNFHIISSYDHPMCINYDNIYLLFKDFLIANTETPVKYNINWQKLFYALKERDKILFNYNHISLKLSDLYWHRIEPFNNLGDLYIYKPVSNTQNFYLTPQELDILNLKRNDFNFNLKDNQYIMFSAVIISIGAFIFY